jgi:hypothetical protein
MVVWGLVHRIGPIAFGRPICELDRTLSIHLYIVTNTNFTQAVTLLVLDFKGWLLALGCCLCRPLNCIVLTTFNVVKGRHMSPN